jgi:hypothetical protein
VNKFKWSIFAASGAFFIAILMGLISGVNFGHIILRALLFAVIFFGLGLGLRYLIDNYFPEILNADDKNENEIFGLDTDSPEATFSVTMNNTGEYAVPELFKAPDDPNEMGNIEDLIVGNINYRPGERYQPLKGVDDNTEAGYNNRGGQGISVDIPEEIPYMDDIQENPVHIETHEKKPIFTPSFGDDDSGLGGLPDLDMMAKAFSSYNNTPALSPTLGSNSQSLPSVNEFIPTGVPVFGDDSNQKSYYKGNKPEPMKGDFNPQELAQGLRTVLNKEK